MGKYLNLCCFNIAEHWLICCLLWLLGQTISEQLPQIEIDSEYSKFVFLLGNMFPISLMMLLIIYLYSKTYILDMFMFIHNKS